MQLPIQTPPLLNQMILGLGKRRIINDSTYCICTSSADMFAVEICFLLVVPSLVYGKFLEVSYCVNNYM